jgi:hypothetical protein
MKKEDISELIVQRASLSEDVFVSSGRIVEDVESLSLDPDIYIAAIEAELGKAGVVNRNGRIYKVGEFISENNRLQARLESGEFVDGELGHPDNGSTFEVAAKLVSVESVADGNTAKASGVFAVLNTSAGRDLMTLFRAGMDVGVSSRGSGVLERLVLDEESEFSEANPTYIGKTVGLVSDFELDTYDLVRVPSAGTFVKRERQDESEVNLHVEAAEELEMSDQNLEIVEEAPVAATDVKTESDPLADLTEDQKEILFKIVEAVKFDNPKKATDSRLAKEVAALREQLAVDRERNKLNESEYAKLNEEHAALREEVETLRAEREERILADKISASINECVEGRRFSGLVEKQLRALVESGLVNDPEAIEPHAARLFGMLEEATTPVVEPVVQEVVDAADDNKEVVEEEVVEEAPQDDISTQLKALINKRPRA